MVPQYPDDGGASGQAWDVKGFRSSVPSGARGGFTVDTAIESVKREIAAGEKVMVDTRNMTPEHVQQLQESVRTAGLDGHVLYWP